MPTMMHLKANSTEHYEDNQSEDIIPSTDASSFESSEDDNFKTSLSTIKWKLNLYVS